MAGAGKPPTLCAFCGLPIKPQQRPSVSLGKGKEAHLECYAKFQEQEKAKAS